MKVAVLISGRGSNMAALIGAAQAADCPAEIVLVISNRADAAGLTVAAARGVATRVIEAKRHRDRAAFEAALTEALEGAEAELVCLAGFMRLLSEKFVAHWRDRLINIHPSLLPAFKGLDTHRRVLEAGARVTGCTVHFVRAAMDDGPIIVQAAVPVRPGDSAETLAARVLAKEHQCYPLAVRWIAEGRVRVAHERVEIAGAEGAEAGFVNPARAGGW